MLSNLVFIFKTIIMGIVEGITEFLPISSTGHLIITGQIINFSQNKVFTSMFEQVIQLGAVLAIIVLFWDKIWNSLKNLNSGQWGFKLWTTIIVACIPVGIIGLPLKHIIDDKLMDNTIAVAAAMIVGGILLLLVENKFRKKAKINDMDMLTYRQAFIIGCFQCLAMWPGMSRSASTIIGGWMLGLTSFVAAEFSFFLSIPTMIGVALINIIKVDWSKINSLEIFALTIGFIVSFIVALLVVEKFMNFLKKKPMRVFSLYRILMGIILLILIAVRVV